MGKVYLHIGVATRWEPAFFIDRRLFVAYMII